MITQAGQWPDISAPHPSAGNSSRRGHQSQERREGSPPKRERPAGNEAFEDLAGGSIYNDLPTSAEATTGTYGPSTANRVRRTNAQLADIDNAILTVLTEEHPATVRSVFYRVMSLGLVEKSENSYRLIGRQLLKLRRQARVPYDHISDGTRYVLEARAYSSASSALMLTAKQYRRRIWDTQPDSVQIFVEKDALQAVISPVTTKWDVPLGVLRGYPSETFVYEVAEALPLNKRTYLYQLGDHDPSGVDAWRSFEAKVRAFNPDAPVVFERLAVTPEQIIEMGLPTRPTKKTDTRAKSFVGGSVEVDAIAPSVLRTIVQKAILRHLEVDAYNALVEIEQHEREQLMRIAREVTA